VTLNKCLHLLTSIHAYKPIKHEVLSICSGPDEVEFGQELRN